jgi:multicomponent Na+:H+ antiporter subunit G
MRDLIGAVLIGAGGVVVLLGLVGVLRFKDFRLQLLAGAKTDTVGFIAIVLGLAVRSGLTWFTAKSLLILAVVLAVNAVTASAIAAAHAAARARTAGADGAAQDGEG